MKIFDIICEWWTLCLLVVAVLAIIIALGAGIVASFGWWSLLVPLGVFMFFRGLSIMDMTW